MIRPPLLNLALTLCVLALAGCGENSAPTQPETADHQSPATTSFALASNNWTNRTRLPDILPRGGLAAGVVEIGRASCRERV